MVITGDLIDNPFEEDDNGDQSGWSTARDFINTLTGADFLVYIVPGNHDYGGHGQQLFASEEYRSRFHRDLWSFTSAPNASNAAGDPDGASGAYPIAVHIAPREEGQQGQR